MNTVRVRVIRSHVLGAGRYAEVGQLLDLPEGVAFERIGSGACVPATPEPAPGAPTVAAAGPPDTAATLSESPPAPAPAAAAPAADPSPSPAPAAAPKSTRGRT